MISFSAARLFKHLVHFREEASESLSIGVKVSVVIDIYRHAELLLQIWSESNSFAESREVEQLAADDAVRVVGWSRECETDGCRTLVELVDDALEAFYHSLQTKVKVVCMSWKCKRLYYEFTSLHGSEYHVCSACIKCQDDAWVSVIVDH